MKIIGLKVDGVRKLTAVQMEFKDNGLVPIKGKNKNGKTTILDSIQLAIRGNKVSNPELIQTGKEKAEIELQLSDYTIKRTLFNNGKTPKLEVKNTKTGLIKKGEVQNFLNTLINEVSFNPFPFKNKTAVEKLKFFMDLCREKLEAKSKELLGYGFAGIDTELANLEQERLLIGREIRNFGDLDMAAPEKFKRVDITGLLQKKSDIEARNKAKQIQFDIEKDKEIAEIVEFNRLEKAKDDAIVGIQKQIDYKTILINALETDIAALEEQLEEKRKKLLQEENILENLEEQINKLPSGLEPKPVQATIEAPVYEVTGGIEAEIQSTIVSNQKAETYEGWLKKKETKAAKEQQYEEYNEKVKALRDKKLEVLRSIDTGVKGLEIREEGIYYNDVYSENWSDSESLTISAEVCIAQMPELRCVFLDRGESFDEDMLAALHNWAVENDVLILTTIVETVPEVEDMEIGVFYIEEGKVTTVKSREDVK